MFTLKAFGKTREITGTQFAAIAIIAVIYIILSMIGIYRFGGWLALLAVIILSAVVTINTTEYAIIRNARVRSIIGGGSLFAGFVYLIYTKFLLT